MGGWSGGQAVDAKKHLQQISNGKINGLPSGQRVIELRGELLRHGREREEGGEELKSSSVDCSVVWCSAMWRGISNQAPVAMESASGVLGWSKLREQSEARL